MPRNVVPGLHKPGRRLLGIDDSPFQRGTRRDILVVGAVCKGDRLDGVLSTKVRQDGWNATARLVEMIRGSKFHEQLHAILLDGITLGGLNMVDIQALARAVERPVIAVMRRYPDREAMARACSRLPGLARRLAILERAGPIHRAEHVYFQVAGLSPEEAAYVVDTSAVAGFVPEPIRLAHLIAGGVTLGQSGRRA